MRWYVNRGGQTFGPLEETELRQWATSGRLRGAMLRDEDGGAWMKAEMSPFAPPKGIFEKDLGFVGILVAGIVVVIGALLICGVLRSV